MGYNPDEFETRVSRFKCFQLPGQPQMIVHQGTANLIDDLWAEVKKLRQEVHDKSILVDVVHGERDAARAELAEWEEEAKQTGIDRDLADRG